MNDLSLLQRVISQHTRTMLGIVLVSIILLSPHTHTPYTTTHAQPDQRCFPETNQCIAGRIRTYWESNGGLPVFGFPTTPQRQEIIEGTPYQSQTFERYRMELHPEHAPPYDVLLGRMGVDRLAHQGRDWHTFSQSNPLAGCRFFEQTRHNVCGDMLTYWQTHGLEFDGQPGTSESESLALFGFPISEPQLETLSDHRTYTVQWFERARFELHPENAPPYHVLLGLLANELRDSSLLKGPGMDTTPVTADSTILSPPRATEQQAVDYILSRGTTYSDYSVNLIVSYYWTVGLQVGVDPLVAIAQNIHETDHLKSWWAQRPRRNPAGLGVTGETSVTPPPDNQMNQWAFDETHNIWRKGLSFADWDIATRAHIGRLLAYAIGNEDANDAQRALINEALALRPLPDSFRGVAPTLRGLNGRWAVPGTTYADKIATFANAIRNQ